MHGQLLLDKKKIGDCIYGQEPIRGESTLVVWSAADRRGEERRGQKSHA